MSAKKSNKKIAPFKPVKLKRNPLTRRKKKSKASNSKSSNSKSSNSKSNSGPKKIKMHNNPLRDCGSVGGGTKKKHKKKPKKNCGCSKSWLLF